MIQLLVGLGNPGNEYAETRHNVGAWLVSAFAEQHNVTLQVEKKFSGLCGTVVIKGIECKLLLPLTYMNLSGQAVHVMANYYKIPLNAILVAHDELDFNPGVVRLKCGGGHGGHKGLQDIIRRFGSSDFYRLRIGIGHPGHKDLVANYVLSRPSCSDRDRIMLSTDKVLTVMPEIIQGKMDVAMQTLHGQKDN